MQCSCTTATVPHLQLNNKLSHAQPALPQPSMQENTIHKHINAFADCERFVAMLACSCTAAAAQTTIKRQALPPGNPIKDLAQHKFITFSTKMSLLHLNLTYAASSS